MNRTTRALAKAWETFEAERVPPAATLTQRTEMRRAFYGGALSTLDAQVAGNAPALPRAMVLHRELEAFAVAVTEGRA